MLSTTGPLHANKLARLALKPTRRNTSALARKPIAENDRGEQRKLIKYNHLLANCLIFHNVCTMTRALYKLRAEGLPIEPETVAALSPYIRAHINLYLDIFEAWSQHLNRINV